MSDIKAEDVQRLADLADNLARIRRDLRHTAKSPPAKIPDLLAQDIAALADYIVAASLLRAQLSHRTGPRAANLGEGWGLNFAATRASFLLNKLTDLLDKVCDLANQVRPRGETRSHFYSPGLGDRVATQFAEADNMLTHTLGVLRDARSGLARIRKRELAREQEALADPGGKAARMLAERARYRGEPLVMVPSGFAAEAAATASAAARRTGRTRLVSTPAPAATADTADTAAPATTAVRR
ncbi:hypothetical protein ACFVUH_08395 [Kitasatospora sp. NPDC058032]|uniref:hypothetical protein n=1 Tax=Kitasatospora sp. NPDC058032 TaxID=3346307 RepID=UPI0036DBC123